MKMCFNNDNRMFGLDNHLIKKIVFLHVKSE